jgi:hypothetical protein
VKIRHAIGKRDSWLKQIQAMNLEQGTAGPIVNTDKDKGMGSARKVGPASQPGHGKGRGNSWQSLASVEGRD